LAIEVRGLQPQMPFHNLKGEYIGRQASNEIIIDRSYSPHQGHPSLQGLPAFPFHHFRSSI
jgi:hypothetical protein